MKHSTSRAALIAVAIASATPVFAGPIQPGLWETTVHMQMAPMPNVPPSVMAQMAQGHTQTQCITPAMAAHATPNDFRGRSGARPDCTVTGAGFLMGHIDTTSVCRTEHGMMTAHMTGTYSPVAMHMVSEFHSADPGMPARRMVIDSRRVGNCAG